MNVGALFAIAMLKMSLESPGFLAPSVRLKAKASDRRVHPRFPPARLGVTRVRIPNRSEAGLVDLSSGGALLQLPYQLRPESRFGVQFDTADSRVELPLQVLRCYVAELRGGVVYHAAGAFEQLLDVKALAQRASSAVNRLLASLEQLERGVKSSMRARSDAVFHEILTDVVAWLRRSESLDLVVLKVKARLTQSHPSLAILPFQSRSFDAKTSLECFGLTFQSKLPLSAEDRRFFKANAQLLSMLEDARRALRDDDLNEAPRVIHSPSEWLTDGAEARPVIDTGRTAVAVQAPRVTAKPTPTKAPAPAVESLRTLEALIFNPAMA